MLHRLRVPDDVARLVQHLHPVLKQKVRAALQAILEAPACGKPLKEEFIGLRSCRLGRLRIVYRLVEGRVIEVVAIGPRRHIYEETYRRIQRSRKEGS